MTNYPLRKPPDLLEYIKNNHPMISLDKDEHNAYRYKEIYASFIVSQQENLGKLVTTVTKKPKNSLTTTVTTHFQVNPQDSEGVELTNFQQLEKC